MNESSLLDADSEQVTKQGWESSASTWLNLGDAAKTREQRKKKRTYRKNCLSSRERRLLDVLKPKQSEVK